MKRVIPYSRKELAWIEKNAIVPRRLLHELFCGRFNRMDVSIENFRGLCKRKGFKTGRDGRFTPGTIPPNKGKKMPYNANTASTQFKKGHLPHNTKYLGHERISREGYSEISVAETNPHTWFERRYVLKHKYLWEQKHGPVPQGMCLKALDGNRLNTDPANWELIPRAMLPLMNGFRGPNYQAADPEIRPVILALTKLRHAALNCRRKLRQRRKKL
jgi:hypothetical protein